MILFHGTDREFDAFSSDFLHSTPGRHENGHLGVWVTTDPDLASRFGKYLLAVETPGDRTFDLDLMSLRKLGDDAPEDPDVFGDFSRSLRARSFDIVAVRESDGTAPTRVILDPEGCRIVGRALVSDADAMAVVKALATEENDLPRWLRSP